MSGFMLIRIALTETSPRVTINPLMNSVRRTFYTVLAHPPEVIRLPHRKWYGNIFRCVLAMVSSRKKSRLPSDGKI